MVRSSFFKEKALDSKPRFCFSSSAGSVIRYTGYDYTAWEESYLILHVNLSGIAVAIPQDLDPLLGEWVILETPEKQYYGTIVHTQSLSEGFKGLVIQFVGLNLGEKFELSRQFSEKQKPELSLDLVLPSKKILGSSSMFSYKSLFLALLILCLLIMGLVLFGPFFLGSESNFLGLSLGF
jgi:hypothetical protein